MGQRPDACTAWVPGRGGRIAERGYKDDQVMSWSFPERSFRGYLWGQDCPFPDLPAGLCWDRDLQDRFWERFYILWVDQRS